jgi:UDP-2,3-diacylglucosamine pyrophosphatase LpxH
MTTGRGKEATIMECKMHRTIFLSDVHLATRGCKAEFLLDFLKHNESEYLYLLGDIVDGWRIKRSFYWRQSHNDVVQKLLRKARKGTKVVYVPGNHDEFLREYANLHFGGVDVLREAVHTTADGKRLLLTHGDLYDCVVLHSRWLSLLGERAYDVLLIANHWFNAVRRRLGYPYWSLSGYLKHKVKNAVEFITRYQDALHVEARKRGLDGVVCGHIHKAELLEGDGFVYANAGDWVESCTAVTEDHDGRLELICWPELANLSFHEVPANPRDEEEPARIADGQAA